MPKTEVEIDWDRIHDYTDVEYVMLNLLADILKELKEIKQIIVKRFSEL